MIKPITIGCITTKNNLFVAPLAGFTDFAFRQECLKLGAGLVYTEMVSAKALSYGNEKTKELLMGSTQNTCAQIFGSEPDTLRWACESEYLSPFKIIDINMGCPAPKIYSNNEGSALLNDLPLASKIISECSKSGKIITVKTRLGVTQNNPVILDFAKMCADSGAQAITVHARAKTAVYSGDCDYELVAKVKQSSNIPVIINGGIFTKQDFENAMNISGADGAMLARGVLENPTLICEILGTPAPTVKSVLYSQLDQLDALYSGDYVAVRMRKAIAYYLKRVRGSKDAKLKIFKATTVAQIKSILNDLEF